MDKFDKDGNLIEEDDDLIVGDDDDDDDTGDDDIVLDDDEDEDDTPPKKSSAWAAMRVENKDLKTSVDGLTRQVADMQAKQAAITPRPVVSERTDDGVPKSDAEWDALAQKDWKKAVDLRSIQNAKSIISKQSAATKADATLSEAKQKVLGVHPELNDNASEKAKIYMTILEQNPDYLTQPKGPLYAMRDMEDYMENTLGYKREDIRSAEQKGAKREASRQHRIVLNKGAGRSSADTGNKMVITKDEMEFCKFQGIDPKEYAKNKAKLSKSGAKEGVTI